MEDTKLQWHPAFCSAIKLELIVNKADLEYTSELNLSSKPLQIDLLVIKKSKDILIDNEIGQIFKQHNIFEYKSPDDTLNIDTYYKTLAYAGIYYISSDNLFQMQIIVSSELNQKAHSWLTALTNQLSTMTARQLICNIQSLTEKDDREYADSVLSVAFKANPALFNQCENKEATNVFEVLMELMKPQIDQKNC